MSSPPKPDMVFRVGVVGHRPNRLRSADLTALTERIRQLLRTIQEEVRRQWTAQREFYSDATPVVRIYSPLAEGVDRIFAEQGLAENCELTAVLPFAQAELERDFAEGRALESNSLERFRRLSNQAKTVFQLDGSRTDESRAYHVAGDVVLNQSDILIVVWDGERKNLRGGTEQTFDDAVDRGVPVVWIDAHAPHHWRIVTQPIRLLEGIRPGVRAALLKSFSADELRCHVQRLVCLQEPPNEHESHGQPPENQQKLLCRFLAERQANCNPAFVWKFCRNFLGDYSVSLPEIKVQHYERAVEQDWPRDVGHPVNELINRLRPFYAWPDKLAERYADAYRSAFILAYSLAAAAVGLALAPLALHLQEHGAWEIVIAIGELAAIGSILALVVFGRYRNWHERWLDCHRALETGQWEALQNRP